MCKVPPDKGAQGALPEQQPREGSLDWKQNRRKTPQPQSAGQLGRKSAGLKERSTSPKTPPIESAKKSDLFFGILRTYDDVVDYVIHELEIRPLYGH